MGVEQKETLKNNPDSSWIPGRTGGGGGGKK